MTVRTPDSMARVFAASPQAITDETRQVALSARMAIDQFAIETGLLDRTSAEVLAARVAVQLQLEDRVK